MASDDTRRGRAAHRAVELEEQMLMSLDARQAAGRKRGHPAIRLMAEVILHDAARIWWERQGYAMPPDGEVEHVG